MTDWGPGGWRCTRHASSGFFSDVGSTITVTDTETERFRTDTNPEHILASRADTKAF